VKVIFQREPLKRFVRWWQRALFARAILLLGYCGSVLLDSWLFQRRASVEFQRLLQDRQAAGQAALQSEVIASPKPTPAAMPDGLIGRIEIPRLLLSAVVMEGVDTLTLQRAVGHIPGTALPGESGNVGLAGHRDTFFRGLKDLKIKDKIQVSTGTGSFTYQVVSLRIVEPDNVGVLAPSGENLLTLVTCYPFYFVGAAPQRWIVRARQVSSQPMTSLNMK
jgi:sortase A